MSATMRSSTVCRRSWALNQIRWCSQVSADVASVSTEETNPLYPPIKPKYPPGRWGGMKPDYAWLWHRHQEESLAIGDVRQRIAALCNKEKNQLVMKVKDIRPRTLELKKYVTKTHTLTGLPGIYDTSLDSSVLDEMASKLSHTVCDLIVMETDSELRRGFLKKFKKAGDQHQREMSHGLLRSIVLHLIAQLAGRFPHLLTAPYDERVTLSAFWDRHGITRTRTRMVHPEYFKFETVDDVCVTSSTTADIVLRADKPLPEFANRDETYGAEIPKLQYSPIIYGQKYEVKGKRHLEAGHVWGDPCEFGSLALLNSVWSRHMATKFGPSHAQDALLGQGIGASFVWLAAQAYNQGFNTLIDVTYPLTTQTVLTDGQTWQFLTYQLNTLQLWKDDEANDRVNLCWVGPQAKLYEEVSGYKVHGFNPDVLKQLIACLALAPADRPYDLRPTLPSSAENPRDREVFVPMRKEEEIVVEEEKYVIE